MNSESASSFCWAIGMAASLYSVGFGPSFIAQHGPVIGGLDHVCLGVVTSLFCRAAYTIVNHVAAQVNPRIGAVVAALAGAAVAIKLGYPAANMITQNMTSYYERKVPKQIQREIRTIFGAIDSLPYRVVCNVPPMKVSTFQKQTAG